jgi:hypothetical protein
MDFRLVEKENPMQADGSQKWDVNVLKGFPKEIADRLSFTFRYGNIENVLFGH